MAGLQAVIFDMDGVLIDSEPLWRAAEVEVFNSVGVPLTEEQCRLTTGLRIDEVVRYWFDRHPWTGSSMLEVEQRILRRLCSLVEERGEEREGARSAVESVVEAGLKLALASSSHHQVIRSVLRRLGMEKLFPVVHSGQDEPLGKPHPGVYLTTAERLGAPAVACAAVEDSLNGVLAAKSARMFCVAVPDELSQSDPRFCIADMTLKSLRDISVTLWKKVG